MTTTALAVVAVFLVLPIVILLWVTESKKQKARRMRKNGHTYRVIASRLNISPTTARRYAMSTTSVIR